MVLLVTVNQNTKINVYTPNKKHSFSVSPYGYLMPTLPTRDFKVQVHTSNFCVVIKAACNVSRKTVK